MIIKRFDPQIYPRILWVVINPDKKELIDKFEDYPEDVENANAFATHTFNKLENKGGVIVTFNTISDATTSNIAHESYHAAMMIYEYCDGKLDFENQEPLAYLIGWVAKCISDTLL